jgi:hypothetical protein
VYRAPWKRGQPTNKRIASFAAKEDRALHAHGQDWGVSVCMPSSFQHFLIDSDEIVSYRKVVITCILKTHFPAKSFDRRIIELLSASMLLTACLVLTIATIAEIGVPICTRGKLLDIRIPAHTLMESSSKLNENDLTSGLLKIEASFCRVSTQHPYLP